MSVTRLAVLKGFESVILGRDIAKTLKEGHVYDITEIMGVLMIRDLGEHAIPERCHDITSYAYNGAHCLTKDEYKNQLKNQEV